MSSNLRANDMDGASPTLKKEGGSPTKAGRRGGGFSPTKSPTKAKKKRGLSPSKKDGDGNAVKKESSLSSPTSISM